MSDEERQLLEESARQFMESGKFEAIYQEDYEYFSILRDYPGYPGQD